MNPGKASELPGLKIQSWEFIDTKAARVYKAEYGEERRERAAEGPLWVFSGMLSQGHTAWEENPGLRTTLKDYREQRLGLTQEQEECLFLPELKPHNPQDTELSTEKSLASIVWNNSYRWRIAPGLPNKP